MKTFQFISIAHNPSTLKSRVFFTTLALFFAGQFAFAQNWLLNGNPGTNPGINFLGTPDAVDLRFRTNNQTRFVIGGTAANAGNVGIGLAAPFSPSYRLHVLSTNNVRAGFFSNTFNSASETFGVRAETNNPGAGNSTGGYFSAIGAGGTVNRAIFGTASGNATNYGAYFQATSAAGQTAIGLLSTANGAGTNYAAQFNGNVFANGNMGIGISPSAYRLFVNGNTRMNGYLQLRSPDEAQFFTIRTDNDGDLEFVGNSEVAMTITDVNGRVGIGTSSPDSRLHIKGNLTLENSENSNTFSIRTATNGDIQFLSTLNLPQPAGPMAFTRLTIRDQDGNIGIGTSEPNSKLHVDGDLRLQSPNDNTFRIRTEDDGNLHFVGDDNLDAMIITDGLGYVGIGTPGAPTAKLHVHNGDFRLERDGQIFDFRVDADGNLRIERNGSTPALFIGDQTGRVGIGTTEVADGYLLSVNGRIISQGVRVQDFDSWPDYVFESGYRLPPLEELEKSIVQNKHLPGIPSAAEVKSEGVDLGEMQRLLLEKVEELTLYVIDLEKQLKMLKQQTATQK